MTSLKQASNICESILLMRRLSPRKKVRIALLGYTDLMLNEIEWSNLGASQSQLTNRSNWKNLVKIHNRPDVTVVPTLTSAIEAIIGNEFSLTVFDFTKYEGSEVEWDFNFPIPKKYIGKFDIVVDYGTCEHIFNIAQALSNVNLMLSKNGIAYHQGGICCPNHGFYGYNPTLFADFYETNGCEIIDMFLTSNFTSSDGKRKRVTAEVPKYERFQMSWLLANDPNLIKLEYSLCTIVQKKRNNIDLTYPTQHKYLQKEEWM